MNEFDSRAKDWDKNQMHVNRSEVIATALLKRLPDTHKMTALEYGAGTGLLSFILKDHFASITLMDSSKEMTKVSQSKIDESASTNMKAIWLDLEKEEFQDQFDIIFNQMVLHHVDNIDLIIGKFNAILKPNGYLAIADLYQEDGSFHGQDFHGHNGFDTEELTQKLVNIKFKNVVIEPCFMLKSEDEKGEIKEFPIFLLTAQKA